MREFGRLAIAALLIIVVSAYWAERLADAATFTGSTMIGSSATTGSIGGGLLGLGECTGSDVAIADITTTAAVMVSPRTYPGDGYAWHGYVSTTGTVTVALCAITTGTPTASLYNVRALR